MRSWVRREWVDWFELTGWLNNALYNKGELADISECIDGLQQLKNQVPVGQDLESEATLGTGSLNLDG